VLGLFFGGSGAYLLYNKYSKSNRKHVYSNTNVVESENKRADESADNSKENKIENGSAGDINENKIENGSADNSEENGNRQYFHKFLQNTQKNKKNYDIKQSPTRNDIYDDKHDVWYVNEETFGGKMSQKRKTSKRRKSQKK
jgi:hypothetical protein